MNEIKRNKKKRRILTCTDSNERTSIWSFSQECHRCCLDIARKVAGLLWRTLWSPLCPISSLDKCFRNLWNKKSRRFFRILPFVSLKKATNTKIFTCSWRKCIDCVFLFFLVMLKTSDYNNDCYNKYGIIT